MSTETTTLLGLVVTNVIGPTVTYLLLKTQGRVTQEKLDKSTESSIKAIDAANNINEKIRTLAENQAKLWTEIRAIRFELGPSSHSEVRH